MILPRKRDVRLLFAMILLGLAACRPASMEARAEMLIRPARLQDISVVVLQTFPPQIRVVAKGYFPDGCTRIDKITQTVEGTVIRVAITTARPAGAMCTQSIVQFQEPFPLVLEGLAPGDYLLDVNGIRKPVTLP